MLRMIGCTAPYHEAIEARLGDGVNGRPPDHDVVVVRCATEELWGELTRAAEDSGTTVIALVESLVLDDYIRALAAGADGVALVDTPSATIVDVITAAVSGEVVLPRQAAQNLAILAQRRKPPTDLDDAETELLHSVASGRSLVELAAELHFSERTVRRHLQSLYLKMGVRNRSEAIALASRTGLLD